MLHSGHLPFRGPRGLLVVDNGHEPSQLSRVAISGSRFDVVGVASGREVLQALAYGVFDL